MAPRLSDQVSALLRQQRHQEAEQLLLGLLDDADDGVDAAELLAAMWTNEERWDEAQALLQDQVAKTAPPSAKLHSLLGDLQRSRGHMEEAHAQYRLALDIDPWCSGAAVGLKGAGDDAAKRDLAERLVATLAGEGGDAMHRAEMHFALGAIFNSLRDYASAFEHFRQANDSVPGEPAYSFNDDYLAVIKRQFTRKYFKSMKGAGHDARLPVFVVGMPRSGTTLLEQTMNRHPAVRGMGELMDIDGIAQAIAASNRSAAVYPNSVSLLGADQCTQFGRRYVDRLRSGLGDSGVLRTVDKNPFNFRHLGLINLVLPRARVIHIQRHPLDTCLSCYFQPFFSQELSFTWSMRHLADYYQRYREIMKHWEKVLPNRFMTLQYQALVQQPEQSMQRVLDFCGLKWDPCVLEASLQDSAIRTASVEQARKPIYQTSLEVWRNYEPFIGPLKEGLAKYL